MDIFVLPDSVDAAAIGASLVQRGYSRVVRYPSGRPWIVGQWNDGEIRSASVKGAQLVLLGRISATPHHVEHILDSIRDPSDTDKLYERVAGSYVTVVRVGVKVRVHGTLASTHEIHYSSVGGVTVASNRAELLHHVSPAILDRDLLPLVLLAPRAPWPLSNAALWSGLHCVPSTDALALRADGSNLVEPRWSYPRAREPLADIAPHLNRVLDDAVRVRADVAPALSSDLSGGLDSTTLAFFADRHARRLITVHQQARDVTNDDARWADLARDHLESVDHILISPDGAESWYAGWSGTSDGDVSAPYPAMRTLAVNRALAVRAHAAGATIHLTGLGGDELFSPSFAHLHELSRINMLRAAAPIRGMQAIGRWTTRATVRALTHSVSHRAWLRAVARDLGRDSTSGPSLSWEPEPRLPTWISASALERAAVLIRAAADGLSVNTGAPPAVDFEMMRVLNADGRLVARMSRIAEAYGVGFDAPYLDDAVIDLAFRVRIEDRTLRGVFKPVLQAAAPEQLPAELRSRRSKGDYSAEAYAGFAAHRGSMIEEFDRGSELEQEGLIDVDEFRTFLDAIHPSTPPLRFLDATLGAEMWLRAVHEREGDPHAIHARREVPIHRG